MLSVRLEGFDKAYRLFDARLVDRAAKFGINDTTRQVRTATSGKIRETWNIKAGDLNKKLRAVKMARAGDLEAIIQAKGRPISLSYFGATAYRGRIKQTRTSGQKMKRAGSRSGVYYQITKGVREHKPNAFMAAVKAGKGGSYHIGVFERKGKERLKIVERKLITIPSMFNQEPVQRSALDTIDSTWPRRFNYHLDRLMDR